MDNEAEIVTNPLPKPTTDRLPPGHTRKDRYYPFPRLYLGQYVHEKIQQSLVGGLNEESGTHYLTHLDTLSDNRIGTHIAEKVQTHIQEEVVPKIRSICDNDPDRKIYWLNEIPFQPATDQVQTLETLKEDAEVLSFAKSVGFESISGMAKAFITEPKSGKILDNLNSFLANRPGDVRKKVLGFLEALQTYYFFDLSYIQKTKQTEDFDINEIPKRFRKIIASATSRPDIIGFSVKKDDKESEQLVEWFAKFSKGQVFGKRPLHDIGSYSPEDKSNIYRLLESIRSGVIDFNLVEIKTQFTKANFKEEIIDDHYKDVAHTLWSMYQLVTAIYRLDNDISVDDVKWKESLLKVMTAETDEERFSHLRKVMRNMRGFIQPTDGTDFLQKGASSGEHNPSHFQTQNKVILARILFPIVDTRHQAAKPFYGLNQDPEYIESAPIKSGVSELDARKLRRSVALTGRRLAKTISDSHSEI